ncbi:MAG: hypothetical protein ACXWD3_16195 [Mycobacterium sp.]
MTAPALTAVALVCSLKPSPASSSSTYWNGEAMQSKDYNDLDEVPEAAPRARSRRAAMLRT